MTDHLATASVAAADAPCRPWTVQCGYAGYCANTVVVDAAEQACALAIELASQSDGWKSLDQCGDTFFDALAPGADVDPWSGAASALPVPAEFTENGDAERMRAALIGLLDWAAMMGGWEGGAWRAAERAVGRRPDDGPVREPTP